MVKFKLLTAFRVLGWVEFYEDRAYANIEVWRWRLKSRNGQNIANGGEAYASYRNARRAFDAVADIAGGHMEEC